MSEKQQPESPLYIHHQYIKDFSFENLSDLSKERAQDVEPGADINIETNAKPLNENTYEVSLKVTITAKHGEEKDYILELVYGAAVSIHKSIEEKLVPAILMVHVPTLLFPYVRNIVSETTAQGGFQPIYLQPVDFGHLFAQQQVQQGQTKN